MPADRPPIPLEPERERAVARLSAAFAGDALTLDELEHRLERAYQARSVDELAALTADLVPGAAPTPLAPAPHASHAPAAWADVEDHGRVLALLSQTVRHGPWLVPRRLEVRAIASELTLDLREAQIAPGITEIELVAVMASAHIVVPPGVRVVDQTMAVMASVANETLLDAPPPSGAPILRVRGTAVMAEVVMRTRRIGDKAR